MPSDAERWRFLSDHQLTLHTDGGDYGYMVHRCKTAGSGEPPEFYPVSNGATAEEAVDRAIERYNRKHGKNGVGLLLIRGIAGIPPALESGPPRGHLYLDSKPVDTLQDVGRSKSDPKPPHELTDKRDALTDCPFR